MPWIVPSHQALVAAATLPHAGAPARALELGAYGSITFASAGLLLAAVRHRLQAATRGGGGRPVPVRVEAAAGGGSRSPSQVPGGEALRAP